MVRLRTQGGRSEGENERARNADLALQRTRAGSFSDVWIARPRVLRDSYASAQSNNGRTDRRPRGSGERLI